MFVSYRNSTLHATPQRAIIILLKLAISIVCIDTKDNDGNDIPPLRAGGLMEDQK